LVRATRLRTNMGCVARTRLARPTRSDRSVLPIHKSNQCHRAAMPRWHASCNATRQWKSPAASMRGARSTGLGSHIPNHQCGETIHATQNILPAPGADCRDHRSGPELRRAGVGGRYDQGGRAPLAVRHDGDQRNGAEGRDADGHRGHQRQGRPARQEARGSRRRPRVELASVRREGAATADPGQGRRCVRLLDIGVTQIRAAGVRGVERPALLPGAVRG